MEDGRGNKTQTCGAGKPYNALDWFFTTRPSMFTHRVFVPSKVDIFYFSRPLGFDTWLCQSYWIHSALHRDCDGYWFSPLCPSPRSLRDILLYPLAVPCLLPLDDCPRPVRLEMDLCPTVSFPFGISLQVSNIKSCISWQNYNYRMNFQGFLFVLWRFGCLVRNRFAIQVTGFFHSKTLWRKPPNFVSEWRVTGLVIKKPEFFNHKPGDWVFIKIPAIALFEWHPFTISSAPEQKVSIPKRPLKWSNLKTK